MPVYHPKGVHTSVTDLSSVVTVTNNEEEGARALLVQALTQNIRYTLSNTTPTASVGFVLRSTDPPFRIDLDEDMSVRFIEETGGAVLQRQWVV